MSLHRRCLPHQSGDYPASVMSEYFIMRLARRVGMNVPGVDRTHIAGELRLLRAIRHVVLNEFPYFKSSVSK